MSKVIITSHDNLETRVAKRAFAAQRGLVVHRTKTAGEIRFVKDQGPEQRELTDDFTFKPREVKPLAKTLLSLSMALGHLISAHSRFTKIKAVNISPDGKLGGKGYIQTIKDMRTNLSTAIETLSSTVDTIDDEVRGNHWKASLETLSEDEQDEVDEIVSDAEGIMDDPEAYDEQRIEEEVLNVD